ncbi:MAG: hypothetical protein H6752_18095 [Candidatus Omnitrophica bacterium]|nr:hypothetical protein [Candidatus Omnitrophota bacterium]
MQGQINRLRAGFGGFFLFLAVFLGNSNVALGGEALVFATPSDDQWQYPFNFSPGVNTDRSVFAASEAPFDNRDAMGLVRWDTTSLVAPGLGMDGYKPVRATITVWEAAGAAWVPSVTETIQLFAVGYGPTYTEATWNEFSAVRANGAGPPTQRDPYPMTLSGERAENEIGAQPWAVGVPAPATAVARPIEFELDLFNPIVREYVQEGLNKGSLTFAVSSTLIPSSSVAAPGTLPRIIFKEGVPIHPGSQAPKLTIELAPDTGVTDYLIDEPSIDVWQYPFNQTPGNRTTAPLFATAPGVGFDHRDGEMVVCFDTSQFTNREMGALVGEVESCSVRVWNVAGASWDLRGATGRLELFGTGFGPTYNAGIWSETSPISAGAPGPPSLRDPYPTLLNGERAENDLNAVPWSVGRPIGYNPGGQATPFVIQFDLNVDDPTVQDYLRDGIQSGQLCFHLATNLDSGDSNPTIVTKEGTIGTGAGITGGDAEAAELRITLGDGVLSADLNQDGVVDALDLIIFQKQWNPVTTP